jgi:hypothetical protein
MFRSLIQNYAYLFCAIFLTSLSVFAGNDDFKKRLPPAGAFNETDATTRICRPANFSYCQNTLLGGSFGTFKSARECPPGIPSNFVVGGPNSTAEIMKLTENSLVAGSTIKELEARMRPGKLSEAGFLGLNESLVSILAEDNKLVVDELGLTHQELAIPLKLVGEAWFKAGRVSTIFEYHDQKLKVDVVSYAGTQSSPFLDKIATRVDVRVVNQASGATITYSGLMPALIERYGFYEGKETPYRVNPKDILKVFFGK